MDELTYLPFDCDNHYYEAEDAFTRHVRENGNGVVFNGVKSMEEDTT